ncbi:hypothetical protein D8Y22_18270 [Salinadaptatus halalkaliphilus]|uniref:CARDB domain-containing protein n=2 Tax=Salinadaptatus halalkaliphilus TaxID=2419781 RepID=A0A4V3VKX3_9EURY|nr:hypothetical protein D8Y22_18270 [Salinadaptatus halalkaliphilus]
MYRRHYLSGVGMSIGSLTVGSTAVSASDHLSVEIIETNAPVEGGSDLEVTAELENRSEEEVTEDIELVVGEDPEVVDSRTYSIEPNDSMTIDHFRFATYPVLQNDEFPVAIQAGGRSAETMVEVLGVDELDPQYAEPVREVSVRPESEIMFEVDTSMLEETDQIRWFVDGEHTLGPQSDRPSAYRNQTGWEFRILTFDSIGTHEVVAVADATENLRTSWEVTVAPDGNVSPSLDAARPATTEVPVEGDYELEVDVSTSGAELDRVIWWHHVAVSATTTDVSGTTDTASIEGGGLRDDSVDVWILDEDNVLTTEMAVWAFDEGATLDNGDESETDADGDSVTIIESNDPVTGGETLEVTATLENTSDETTTLDVELVVGEDPEVVETRSVTVASGSTEQVTLEFETYPVEQDDSFPVRVETAESADEREVTVYGTGE